MLVSLSPLTLYSSSHHSSMIGALSCEGQSRESWEKLTLMGAGNPWGHIVLWGGGFMPNLVVGPWEGSF